MQRNEFLAGMMGQRKSVLSPVSGLNPYGGPWTKKEAMHLLRRTLFGVKKTDLDKALSIGMSAMVDSLLDPSQDPIPGPPLNNYSLTQEPNEVAPGTTWVNDPVSNTGIPPQNFQNRKDSLKMWWTGNIINQKSTLVEKITLFWFNHFAVELDQVPVAQPVYFYYKMLRENCLGDFRTMLKRVTLEPTMLFYLNGYINTKTAPDENFAREVQELFTVGKGPDSKYTESDVKEAARLLTGIRINPLTNPISYYFDIANHDLGIKTFSSFYGNKSIPGSLSIETEVDGFLKMLTDNIETARFLCRKLYQYFVYYEITSDIENNVIKPLADFMVANQYNIKLTLSKLLKSEHFFDVANFGCVIKNPFDYAVGIFKEFSVKLPDSSNIQNQYFSWGGVTILTAYQGLNIADPPVVSGYQPWYQAPQFHEIWINADTFANKNNVASGLFSDNGLNISNIKYKIDPFIFSKSLSKPESATELVKEATERLYNHKLSDASITYLKGFLISGLPDETYWTDIWENYIADPTNPQRKAPAETRLNEVYREIISQAEYHLS
ncbi:MAG: DUF1800 domain-containing protein [Saprospiraceae bacterium]|nr:DUF1800 domain-containing protein [Saprospiraceae bacterium]